MLSRVDNSSVCGDGQLESSGFWLLRTNDVAWSYLIWSSVSKDHRNPPGISNPLVAFVCTSHCRHYGR